jgi:hypothetical protein
MRQEGQALSSCSTLSQQFVSERQFGQHKGRRFACCCNRINNPPNTWFSAEPDYFGGNEEAWMVTHTQRLFCCTQTAVRRPRNSTGFPP